LWPASISKSPNQNLFQKGPVAINFDCKIGTLWVVDLWGLGNWRNEAEGIIGVPHFSYAPRDLPGSSEQPVAGHVSVSPRIPVVGPEVSC
jgi:hypothetical protein